MGVMVRAIYENGVFRPTGPVPELANGASVVLTIEIPCKAEKEGVEGGLTSRQVRELIRSKDPQIDLGQEESWEETEKLLEMSLSNRRDPEVMRKGAEDMDRLREQIYRREGLLDIVMPLLRESRDDE
jgi:predicted DNA-binding antitoxin AbrB/MazE fold protein